MFNKLLHRQAITLIPLQSTDSYSIHSKGKRLLNAVQQNIAWGIQ